jgi:hypothetical protein
MENGGVTPDFRAMPGSEEQYGSLAVARSCPVIRRHFTGPYLTPTTFTSQQAKPYPKCCQSAEW